MPVNKLNGFVSNSNYFSFDGSNENLTIVGKNYPLTKSTTLSAGVGFDNDIKYTNGKFVTDTQPAIEVKLKQNIAFPTNIGNGSMSFNSQARFRKIGGSEQYRVGFGANYKIDKNQSVYTAVHATAKNKNGEWNNKAGIWAGYTYSFNHGTSISAEIQYNTDRTKSFNIMTTIPF